MHYSEKAPKWLNGLWKLENVCAEGISVIATVMFCAVVSLIMVQVVCRYAIGISCAWAEELARYIWMPTVFLGCAYATHIDKHIDIDLSHIFIKLGKSEKSRVIIAKVLYVYRFLMILLIGGYYSVLMLEYTEKIIKLGKHLPASHIPLWVFIAGMTFGMILICLSCLSQIIFGVLGFDYRKTGNAHAELDEVDMSELGGADK